MLQNKCWLPMLFPFLANWCSAEWKLKITHLEDGSSNFIFQICAVLLFFINLVSQKIDSLYVRTKPSHDTNIRSRFGLTLLWKKKTCYGMATTPCYTCPLAIFWHQVLHIPRYCTFNYIPSVYGVWAPSYNARIKKFLIKKTNNNKQINKTNAK